MISQKLFKGICPALYTCFKNDGTVNYAETARLAEWLVSKGANGFYICGTTGSGLLLSKEERKKITVEVSAAVGNDVPIMVHVGSMATDDAIELARHAENVKGVAAISSLPPQYYSMPLEDEVYNLDIIAKATDLPFYPYLFQSMIDKYGVMRIAESFKKIHNFRGIKAFVSDLSIHQTISEIYDNRIELLHGFDQCLCQALMISGIEGAIGSIYNILPEIAVGIKKSVDRGSYAEGIRLQRKFSHYWISIQGFSFLAFGYYFLIKRGFEMGFARLPLRMPTEDVINTVERKLNEFEFDIHTGGI